MATISPARPPADREAVRDTLAELSRSVGELRCAGSQQLVRAGISMSHLHVMWMLQRHGDLSMGRLAEMLDVSLSNATGLIDRMEERGLIERVRVPDDRRVVLVALSARGRQMLELTDVMRSDLLEAVLRRLDGRQLACVAQALRDVTEALRAAREAGDLPPDTHDHAH
ncbi:MAG TPA: MarR family transcriptional regulator [Candidatus Dormibacteraeota bacterium]|nr:MarR family transcriptional regulator [Candidatus Dormibacteraeota bacterium]